MVKGNTLLRQVQALVPRAFFENIVARTRADYKVQKAGCWSHLQTLLISLLTGRSSLRDMATTFEDRLPVLKSLGIGSVNRSTLSYANRHRPAAVLRSLLTGLVDHFRAAFPDHHGARARRFVRLDSTVIRVSHTQFPWAVWAQGRSAIRLHIGLEGASLLPAFVRITAYAIGERTVARTFAYAPGTILCFDRGYLSPAWFATLAAQGLIFLTRWRSDVLYRVVRPLPVAKHQPVVADEIIRFSGRWAAAHCSLELRRIEYRDPHRGKELVFLTNALDWPAQTVADLYRRRWEIETFFRFLKQTLKVRRFYSLTENGVEWHILSALLLYLLLKIMAQQCTRGWSLGHLLRKLAAHLLDRQSLVALLQSQPGPPILSTISSSSYS